MRADVSCDVIRTPRLLLEPLTAAHAPALYPGLRDVRVYEWISAKPPISLSALSERYALKEAIRRGERTTCIAGTDADCVSAMNLDWAVRVKQTEQYIGKLDIELEGNVATNVGYLLFSEFWNQGFATEALIALAATLERSGVVEQRACVTRGNDASARVLQKSGFYFTRVIPDNDTIRGRKFDDLEYVRANRR